MTIINHECYVSLEVAKLLKKAGFDLECRGYFDGTKFHPNGSVECTNYNSNTCKYLKAPTLDVAQRWLREMKNCYLDVMVESDVDDDGNITFDSFTTYYVFIGKPHGLADSDGVIYGNFDTYESALEAGINKVLEIILEKVK